MDRAAFARGDFPEVGAVAEIIGISEEAWPPVVATQDDVLRYAGNIDSRWAGHGGGIGGVDFMHALHAGACRESPL